MGRLHREQDESFGSFSNEKRGSILAWKRLEFLCDGNMRWAVNRLKSTLLQLGFLLAASVYDIWKKFQKILKSETKRLFKLCTWEACMAVCTLIISSLTNLLLCSFLSFWISLFQFEQLEPLQPHFTLALIPGLPVKGLSYSSTMRCVYILSRQVKP